MCVRVRVCACACVCVVCVCCSMIVALHSRLQRWQRDFERKGDEHEEREEQLRQELEVTDTQGEELVTMVIWEGACYRGFVSVN